ncbi:MAG: Fic family protein [Candidatus Levybacteria bacterium]|nr:Fic family protein [Candidatus Levybacteria bacterium]
MFEPTFHITMPIVNTLGTIERLYGQLIGKNLIPSLALRLSEENQVLATHYSTSIEGNPLSPQDVTNVVLGDRIPTTKSEKEVKNYFAVINHLFILARQQTPITTELTLTLHKQLMDGIMDDAGSYRDGSVFVGHKTKTEIVVKHNPPFHTRSEIMKALEEVYAWVDKKDEYHPLLKAGVLHHQFAYIHPFFDGNGRMARLLTTYYLLLKQYEVVKYFIIDDYYDIDRYLYSDTLHTADTGDKTKWLEYFLEGIAESLQGSLARIEELERTHLDSITGEKRVLVSSREEEVLQIVIDKKAIKTSDIEESFGVSRQQAHSLLASLVSKGILEKFGSTKTSYYKLAKGAHEK